MPTTLTSTTYSPKAAEVHHNWFVVDANGHTLGRLATEVARILRGKHKPVFAEHMDMGDYVIVINAEKIAVTGKKPTQKIYYRHSNYPGGFKQPTYAEVMKKFPIRIIESAVKGMLPHNRLGKQQYLKLKVYAGAVHPHEAQKPEPLVITENVARGQARLAAVSAASA
ncbi:MAG: 50S ribosomal protein L13 [Chloroflexota bacterium]|nr:50S ribosomal protein L13 [Chloroflexota bacterium]